MEIWAKNLGPIKGEHHLVTVTGPGLYEITGPNTRGKSTLALVMLLFGEERLLSSDAAYVTDGEVEGYLMLEPARLTFDGSGAPKRTNAGVLPSIEEIPHPIELLVSGGSDRQRTVKDPRIRAKNRLEQLLAFAPMEANDAHLDRLCRAMDEKSFCTSPTSVQAIAWEMLMAQVAERVARFKLIAPLGPIAITTQVMEARQQGAGSALDDQQALHKLLNRLANAAAHAAEEQRTVIASVEGRVAEALAAAARHLGEPPTPAFRTRLETWSGDPVTLREELDRAKSVQARTRVSHERKGTEQERRGRLAASHGERPADEEEQTAIEEAREVLREAEGAHSRAAAAESEAIEDFESFERIAGEKLTALRDAWSAWSGLNDRIETLCGSPSSPSQVCLPETATATALLRGDLVGAAGVFADAITAARSWEGGRITIFSARSETSTAKMEAHRGKERASDRLTEERRRLVKAAEEINRWELVAALIAEPVDGPSLGDVEVADAAVRKIEAELDMSGESADFRRLLAELHAESEILTWLQDLETDYRAAAAATWLHLGDVVTENLSLPWLKVEGMDLVLAYDTETKRLATGETSPSKKEERRLDDQKRVSTAELHEAMLGLMLDRRKTDVTEAGRSPMVIFPWDYERPSAIAALDGERTRRFAAAVEDHGLVIFAERPSRDGEPDKVRIVKVEALR